MNPIVKGVSVLAGVSGAVGGGLLIAKNIGKTDSISNHIKTEYLLTTSQTEKWNHRVSLLKGAKDGDLDSSLLPLKKDGLTNKELQEWCTANLKEKFEGEKSTKFLNVKLYCGLNMGDKITGNKVIEGTSKGENKLTNNFKKLNGKSEAEVGSELIEIGKKTNQSDVWEGNEALKNWCLKTLDLAFEENSRDYNNAKAYCVLV